MKRLLSAAFCAALCACLCACGGTSSTSSSSQSSGSSDAVEIVEEEPIITGADIALNGGNGTIHESGLVDDETGAFGPMQTVDPYASGIHHANLKIKGYPTMEIEIYANTAPKTSALFCYLVRHGYYDNMELSKVMKDMYLEIQAYDESDRKSYTVDGEFDEAGFTGNLIGLKRGVIAMSRANTDDTIGPTELSSDASGLYIFLSDVSYLDGKYAGFAKITKGVSTLDSIISAMGSTNDDGTVSNKANCPVIKSIKIVD